MGNGIKKVFCLLFCFDKSIYVFVAISDVVIRCFVLKWLTIADAAARFGYHIHSFMVKRSPSLVRAMFFVFIEVRTFYK